ncbi:MAG TPA: hypothetical protein [Caudoviricetes sp.]|nr:MAG TPA: hypothetical protein [Caudoviricetes sp.]
MSMHLIDPNHIPKMPRNLAMSKHWPLYNNFFHPLLHNFQYLCTNLNYLLIHLMLRYLLHIGLLLLVIILQYFLSYPYIFLAKILAFLAINLMDPQSSNESHQPK